MYGCNQYTVILCLKSVLYPGINDGIKVSSLPVYVLRQQCLVMYHECKLTYISICYVVLVHVCIRYSYWLCCIVSCNDISVPSDNTKWKCAIT